MVWRRYTRGLVRHVYRARGTERGSAALRGIGGRWEGVGDVYAAKKRLRGFQRVRVPVYAKHAACSIFHRRPKRASSKSRRVSDVYLAALPALVLSVYIFLLCIRIVVVNRGRTFLWITTYISIGSDIYVYRKHRERLLAGVDDSAIRMRTGGIPRRLVPAPSPCHPLATHTKPARLSTDFGRLIHMRGGIREVKRGVAPTGLAGIIRGAPAGPAVIGLTGKQRHVGTRQGKEGGQEEERQ